MDHVNNLRMSALHTATKKHKVTVVGSGNWGSTIAKVVAENTAAHPDIFERDVQMWVYEEEVQVDKKSKHFNESSELCQGKQKLTKVINEVHENVKYLPGIQLPVNVIANPSLTDSVKNSTILIFNLPHQFIVNLCKQLQGHILPYARGISCIKGVDVRESEISLFSESIGHELNIYCGALSGANIASEVALEKFSETTIAYDPPVVDSQTPTPAGSTSTSPASSHVDLTKIVHKDVSGNPSKIKLKALPADYQPIEQETIRKLFHRPYFHVRVVSDVAGVSLGGALKNVVAVAAGWVDGLGWGDNAKAAIMRVGLLEMVDFGKRFFAKTVQTATFLEESAGVADLITTCNGGRNHRCAKMSIIEGKSIEEIEARELNGQKLQGTLTAYEVNTFLKAKGLEKEFPLFTAVYDILKGTEKVQNLPALLERNSRYKTDEPPGYTVAVENTSGDSPERTNPQSSSQLLFNHDIDNSESERTSVPGPRTTANNSSPKSSIQLEARHAATSPTPVEDSANTPRSNMSDNKTSTNNSSALLPAPSLASSRYSRQLLVPQISLQGQQRLSESRVLIVGLGGLGSPASLYLAGAGIGTLGFLDHDVVEESNLHRQIVHRQSSLGITLASNSKSDSSGSTQNKFTTEPMTKVDSATRSCRDLNPLIEYKAFNTRLSVDNALDVVDQFDLVLDCTDNPATRYLISDACVVAGKTLISGAAQRLEGQLMILNYPVPDHQETSTQVANIESKTASAVVDGRGPCYRCVFPRPPPPDMVRGCGEIGILGPVVGVIGTLMATEAIKLIVQDLTTFTTSTSGVSARSNQPQRPSMLLYNAWSSDPRTTFRSIGLRGRRQDCLACGDEDVLKTKDLSKITRSTLQQGRVDYEAFCGKIEDVKILNKDERVQAKEFLNVIERFQTDGRIPGHDTVRENEKTIVVIDVREENDYILGAKVRGSVNIPISKIVRDSKMAFEQLVAQSEYDMSNTTGFQASKTEDNDMSRSMYFVCQQGNDSQIAAKAFQDFVTSKAAESETVAGADLETPAKSVFMPGSRWKWVGDIEGGFVAMEKVVGNTDS